jgi:hypothetical protein
MKGLDSKKIALILWFLFSIVFCIGALRLPLGSPAHPSAGFMPLLIGIVMSILSILGLLKNIFMKIEPIPDKTGQVLSLKNLTKPMMVSAALVGYGLVLPRIGFEVSTLLLMFFLFKGFERQGWIPAVLLTIVTVAISYVLFVIWLDCQFPTVLKF